MKAFVVDKYKKKGALRLTKVPEPEVRDDDVMVRVHATGVNLLDSKVRNGEFKLFLPYRPPQGQAVQGGRRGLCTAARSSGRNIRGIHCHE
jgi:NADPH:quinone reductase-like Zn-dependent oxidoreductase